MEKQPKNSTTSVDEAEDDYMNMIITEPTKPKEKETYTQRRLRKEREAETKRPKSKAELARLAAEKRDEALARPIHETEPSSKGLKMMQAMGFQAGGALGKPEEQITARTEPLSVQVKEDRGGIGLDSEKKRKVREAFEGEAKRQKVDEEDYRERVRLEREERRLEGQILAAQKVAEKLDADALSRGSGKYQARGSDVDGKYQQDASSDDDDAPQPTTSRNASVKAPQSALPLSQIPVLWRGLTRHRLTQDRERRMRHDLQQSLSRVPTYEGDNTDEDGEEQQTLGRTVVAEQDAELDQEDAELDGFNARPPMERLVLLVRHLRDTWRYCFWCKFLYPDESFDGCPGLTEEDHD